MPVVIRQDIPAHLIKDTPEPAWNGTTNADLVEHILDLRQALRRCNAKNAAIGAAGKE